MKYKRTAGKAVPHVETKWDTFTLINSEHPYRHQKGSGRSECFMLAKDGMKVGEWTKLCSAAGFDARFAIGGLLKLQGAAAPGWQISAKNAAGENVKAVQNARKERTKVTSKPAAKAA